MTDDPDAPGEGDEPYLTPVQANKIVASLLNRRKRFPYDVKVAQFAIRQTIKNMKHSDARVRNVAVANLIKMETLNQKDDFAQLAAAMGVLNPKKAGDVNVTVGVQVIGDPALQQKAEQYGLTQSRLAGMIEANGHTNGNGHANGFHPDGSDTHN